MPKPQAIHCLVGREKLRVSGPAEYNKRKGSYDTGDWGLGVITISTIDIRAINEIWPVLCLHTHTQKVILPVREGIELLTQD